MLREIIEKLEKTEQPVTLKELSRELGIEPEALRGMLEYLNRKGKVAFQCEACREDPASSCKDCRHRCIAGKAQR